MSSDRAETAIVALVLVAAGGVLLAPVAGRVGSRQIADVLMLAAAGAGVAAFAIAAGVTLRAARGARSAREEER